MAELEPDDGGYGMDATDDDKGALAALASGALYRAALLRVHGYTDLADAFRDVQDAANDSFRTTHTGEFGGWWSARDAILASGAAAEAQVRGLSGADDAAALAETLHRAVYGDTREGALRKAEQRAEVPVADPWTEDRGE